MEEVNVSWGPALALYVWGKLILYCLTYELKKYQIWLTFYRLKVRSHWCVCTPDLEMKRELTRNQQDMHFPLYYGLLYVRNARSFSYNFSILYLSTIRVHGPHFAQHNNRDACSKRKDALICQLTCVVRRPWCRHIVSYGAHAQHMNMNKYFIIFGNLVSVSEWINPQEIILKGAYVEFRLQIVSPHFFVTITP